MLADAQASRYLERLGYRGDTAPTRATLAALHHAHMLHVPFENLDVVFGTPITLSIDAFYLKIVERRRGGFCYELNTLFAALLQTLGFKLHLIAADVFNNGHFGELFDHLLLGVELDGEILIADVGFGDSFRAPLTLDGSVSQQLGAAYRVEFDGACHILHADKPDGSSQPQYRFALAARAMQDFAARCHYQQTSPLSHFTRRSICSVATETGRVTLSDGRLVVTAKGARTEKTVADEAHCRTILLTDFGIATEAQWDLSRLLAKQER